MSDSRRAFLRESQDPELVNIDLGQEQSLLKPKKEESTCLKFSFLKRRKDKSDNDGVESSKSTCILL